MRLPFGSNRPIDGHPGQTARGDLSNALRGGKPRDRLSRLVPLPPTVLGDRPGRLKREAL